MGRGDYDYDDERSTRSTRQSTQRTERLNPEDIGQGEPIGSDWRRTRTSSRTRQVGAAFPRSREELVIWLQHQNGWRTVMLAAIGLIAIIALAIIIFSPNERANPTASITPVPTLSELSSQFQQTQSSVTPQASVTAAPAPSAISGAQFRVFNTGPEGLFLRPDPNSNNTPLKTLPDGTIVTVIGEDYIGPDRVWKNVRDQEGAEGWAASDWLEPAQ
jgi:hypothetical protein